MGALVWVTMQRRWATLAGLAGIVLGAGIHQFWLLILGGVVFLADLIVRSGRGYRESKARQAAGARPPGAPQY